MGVPKDLENFGPRSLLKKRLVCMMGLPRSGKSTAARKLSQVVGAPIVNRDSIRLAMHGQRYQKLAEPLVKATAIVMVRALFNVGHTVVIVDETSVSRSTRDFWRDDENVWQTCVLEVPTPLKVCMRRAQASDDKEIMPVIAKMADMIEPLMPDEPRFDFVGWGAGYPELSEVAKLIEASVKGSDLA